MTSSKLKGRSTNELKSLFESLCIEQYNALERNEIAAFNKRYSKIQEIVDELKSRPGDQRRVLMQLFGHPNIQFSLTAAKFNLAVDYIAARREIQDIVDSKWFPQAGDAGMTLHHLDTGVYKPT